MIPQLLPRGLVLPLSVYSGGWQDLVISLGMLVFILSVAGMILDETSFVAPVKGVCYGCAQLMVAAANASLGLWLSAGLLLIGGVLWWTLSYQSWQQATSSVSTGEGRNI